MTQRDCTCRVGRCGVTVDGRGAGSLSQPFVAPVSQTGLTVSGLVRSAVAVGISSSLLGGSRSRSSIGSVTGRSSRSRFRGRPVSGGCVRGTLSGGRALCFHSSFFDSIFRSVLGAGGIRTGSILGCAVTHVNGEYRHVLGGFRQLCGPLYLASGIVNVAPSVGRRTRRQVDVVRRRLSLFLFGLLSSTFFVCSFGGRLGDALGLIGLLGAVVICLSASCFRHSRNGGGGRSGGSGAFIGCGQFASSVHTGMFGGVRSRVGITFRYDQCDRSARLRALCFLVALHDVQDGCRLSIASVRGCVNVGAGRSNSGRLPRVGTVSVALFLCCFTSGGRFSRLESLVISGTYRQVGDIPVRLRGGAARLIVLLLSLVTYPGLSMRDGAGMTRTFNLAGGRVGGLLGCFGGNQCVFAG